MDNLPGAIRAITISQQYGSEGHKVAAKLAFRLRWLVADREIGRQVAHLLSMTTEEAALYDEHAFNVVERILLSLQCVTVEAAEAWGRQASRPTVPRVPQHLYSEVLRQVVKTFAQMGNVVLVGHGAQAILAHQADVLHVRLVAPLEQRVRYSMRRNKLEYEWAEAYLAQRDRDMRRYLQTQYQCDIDDPLLYDLVMNSASLTLDAQVDLICQALQHKARGLALVAS